MDKRKFESLLQETLEEKSMPVSMSETRKEQICQAVRARSETVGQTGVKKEETVMKPGFKRKVILVAAAMCVFGTVAALAAGKITGYYTGTRVDRPDYKNFADLSAVEEQTGFAMKAVEEFENGFRFRVGYQSEVEARDEEGNVVETFPEVMLRYTDGEQELTVTAQKVREEDGFEGKVSAEEYKGMTLLYKEDQYLFVPPSYEPSDEELKAQEAGELYISFGTSEVEHDNIHFMRWDENGTRYLLMSSGEKALGQEAMTKMAREIIDSAE